MTRKMGHDAVTTPMAEIPDAVYEAAMDAYLDAWGAGLDDGAVRAAIDAVAPILIAEGRRQAAEAIRAQPYPEWAQAGGRSTPLGLREWAATIAEGVDDA